MKFYYTGATNFNSPQTQINKSLGGFMSSSSVPNLLPNNLFGSISFFTLEPNKFDIIGLILKNETEDNVTNLKIFFNQQQETDFCNYQIAIVPINTDSKGGIWIEKIPSTNSIPYQANFEFCYGESEAFEIATLNAGQSVGVWFKRNIDIDKVNEYFSDQKVEERFNSNLPPILEEKIILNLKW